MAVVAKTYPNILKYGLQAAYNDIAVKDPNVLYFCTDTKKIYKGNVDFTDSVVLATSHAEVTSPIVGKLYVFSSNAHGLNETTDFLEISRPLPPCLFFHCP